jgi:hypothetical protein
MPSNENAGDAGRAPRGGIASFVIALILGLAGILLIAFLAHFYEVKIFLGGEGRAQIILNALTPLVFFMILLVVALLNPLIHLVRPRWSLSSAELLIVLSLWLLTGVICFANMASPILTVIGQVYGPPVQNDPAARRAHLLSYLNPSIFLPPDAAKDFYYGASPDGKSWVAPFPRSPLFRAKDLPGAFDLGRKIEIGEDSTSTWLREKLPQDALARLRDFDTSAARASEALTADLNRLLSGPRLFEGAAFERFAIPEAIRKLLAGELKGEALVRVNRLLTEDAVGADLAKAPAAGPYLLSVSDFRNMGNLVARLRKGSDPRLTALRDGLSPATRDSMSEFTRANASLQSLLADQLNRFVDGPCLLEQSAFARMQVSDDGRKQINRLLLESAYPALIAPSLGPGAWELGEEDMINAPALAELLHNPSTPLATLVRQELPVANRDTLDEFGQLVQELKMSPDRRAIVKEYVSAAGALLKPLTDDLNSLLQSGNFYSEARFKGVTLSNAAKALLAGKAQGRDLVLLNRTLLADAYPKVVAAPVPGVAPELRFEDLSDLGRLAFRLSAASDPLSADIKQSLSKDTLLVMSRYMAAMQSLGITPENKGRLDRYVALSDGLRSTLAEGLNAVLAGPLVFDPQRFQGVTLSETVRRRINRALMEEGYRQEIAKLPPAVPWAYWVRPLAFWIPFMLAAILFSASLVRTVQRQWSKHELLSYPLADFSSYLIRRQEDRALPEMFYDRVFWLGFSLTVAVYLINGLSNYFPLMIQVPLYFDQREITNEFNFLAKYCGAEAYSLFRGWVYPFIVCITVMLPTEISLSCWLGWVIMVLSTGAYFLFTGEVIGPSETRNIQYGMYLTMAAAILIIGRREYWGILRCAVAFRRTQDDELRRAARACQTFLLASAALIVLLVIAGLDWLIALALVLAFGLIVLLIARMTAEIGDPWLVNFWGMASTMPLRLLGVAALGPKDLTVLSFVGQNLDPETTNTIAAQTTTIEWNRERLSGWIVQNAFSLILAVGVLAAMAATLFFTIWDDTSFGSRQEPLVWQVEEGRNNSSTAINRFQAEGRVEQLSQASGLGKLKFAKVETKALRFMIYGAAAVGICAFMRLRFSWWPFHPLPLLFINTWAMSRLFFPFFLGWIIKITILKIWGGRVFARSKPFFYGVILGTIAMFGVWIIVGILYFLITDARPPAVNFFH